jgi:hypothetical protein
MGNAVYVFQRGEHLEELLSRGDRRGVLDACGGGAAEKSELFVDESDGLRNVARGDLVGFGEESVSEDGERGFEIGDNFGADDVVDFWMDARDPADKSKRELEVLSDMERVGAVKELLKDLAITSRIGLEKGASVFGVFRVTDFLEL